MASLLGPVGSTRAARLSWRLDPFRWGAIVVAADFTRGTTLTSTSAGRVAVGAARTADGSAVVCGAEGATGETAGGASAGCLSSTAATAPAGLCAASARGGIALEGTGRLIAERQKPSSRDGDSD